MQQRIKMITQLLRLGAVVVTAVMLQSCIDADSLHTELNVNADLSGTLVIDARNIHSNLSDKKEQKNELDEFVTEEFKILAEDIKDKLGLSETKSDIARQTDNSANAILQGEFSSLRSLIINPFFLSLINADIEKYPYHFHSDDNSMTAEFYILGNKSFSENILTIRVNGEVKSHNATKFDQKNNKLTWIMKGDKKALVKLKFKLVTKPIQKTK